MQHIGKVTGLRGGSEDFLNSENLDFFLAQTETSVTSGGGGWQSVRSLFYALFKIINSMLLA